MYGARRYALAEPLKEILQRAFDIPREHLWGTQAQKEAVIPGLNMSGRWLMQHLGTDGIRTVLGEDFWVKLTLETIRKDNPSLAVIEDVRFLSEVKGIQDHPLLRTWSIWKLHAPWRDSKADPTHQSESELTQIQADFDIAPATKSLEALYTEIDKACANFRLKPLMNAIEAP
jgi:hypothetical protein